MKNVGAIPWKSDWQIYYCGEVNKFWLGVDEIEEAAIYEKSHSVTLIFHGPHFDNGIYTKAKKVSLLRRGEVYPILFRGNEQTGSFFLYDCDDAKSTAWPK